MLNSTQLPPGPKSPSVIQLANWIVRPVEFMRSCRSKYGDSYTMRFPGFPPMVVITDPEKIKMVFSGNVDTFQSGIANRLLKTSMGENSILVLDGDSHIRLRRVMQEPLHGRRMKAYRETMLDACHRVSGSWPQNHAFALYPQIQLITLKVIIENIFGMASGEDFSRIEKSAVDLIQMFSNPWGLMLARFDGKLRFSAFMDRLGPLSPGKWMRRKLDPLDRALYQQIRKKKEQGANSNDILSLLLNSKDENGRNLTDREIRDQLVTMLAAGHETTATAICWVMYHLLSNAAVMNKLKGQLRQHNWDENTPYLDAVVREGLRLNPVVPMVVRYLNKTISLKGLELPEGIIVAPCIYLVHHNDDLYGNAGQFNPDRMLEQKTPVYEYFPFGGGIRHCIGWAFASYEMKVVLSYMLRNFTIKLKPGYKLKVSRRGLTLVPSQGLPVVVQGA